MNAETAALIEESRGWKELSLAASSGRLPQAVGVSLPSVMHGAFAELYGRLVLGEDNLWSEGCHPDMIIIGGAASAPTIEECRKLQGELALHPLAAPRRLAVVRSADKLAIEASNSLLKITEEPPLHGSILFISEENNLIPTIKSRIWSVHIALPEEITKTSPAPRGIQEWARWMDAGRKPSPEILFLEMQGWTRDFAEKGDYLRASKLDSLIRVMELRRLPVSMIQDAAFAVLREEVPYEKILGGLW